jgi:alcohol dehydrogenase (cytochrome c)
VLHRGLTIAIDFKEPRSPRSCIKSGLACLVTVLFAGFFLCQVGTRAEETNTTGSGPRSDDWFTINKNYFGQRYVDLDQITLNNVGTLKEVCEIQLNENSLFSTGLLKVDRTLYFTLPRLTYAIDAATCDLRWLHPITYQTKPMSGNNRGSAYLDGSIFRGTPDGYVIALDANTGEPLPTWPQNGVLAADANNNETFVSAPIAWQGKVFIGIGIGDSAIAGRLMAFDAKTGNELWSFQTTLPGPDGTPAKAGGGLWTTYSLDPKTGEVFAGVANPYPDFIRDTDNPPGSIAFTNSVISVDAASGRLNWHYQAVPHDEHDWDLAAPPTLYRTSNGMGGKDMLAIAGKSGIVYGIDRSTRIPVFDTPGTTLENNEMPLSGTWLYVCPGVQGGAMFIGPAYNPGTGTLYLGMNDHCAWYIKNSLITGGQGGGGSVVKDWPAAAKLQAPRGWVTAINGATGAVLWQYQAESQVLAGIVPTKSGLLFAGDTHGNLLAFDAANGDLVKSIDTGGALNSGLISYSVGGDQYVAATVGGPTQNPSTVAGPLRVVVYGLNGGDQPKVVALNRQPASPELPPDVVAFTTCTHCHGPTGGALPLARQSQLADPVLLKQFLATVPPPMPRLYPGVLTDSDVELIAHYLKTTVFMCDSTSPPPPQRCAPPAKPSSGGTLAWQAIYTDLTSPRCINCHPVASPNLPGYAWNPTTNAPYPQDYPRQGDDRHPHYYTVLRGDPLDFPTPENPNVIVQVGMGTPYEHCIDCHGTENDSVTGIPGTTNPDFNPGQPFWFLAPASMAWESAPGVPLTGPQLCAALLDMSKNGNRTPQQLMQHITNEPLVKWSFNPGIAQNGQPRTTPPIPQAELIQWFQQWINDGTPCPKQ